MLMIVTEIIPPRRCGHDCWDPEVRKIWGCDSETSEFPLRVERDWGGFETTRRCPWALANESNAWAILQYAEGYDDRFLPSWGGLDDQPPKLMQAIQYVRRLLPYYRKLRAAEDEE